MNRCWTAWLALLLLALAGCGGSSVTDTRKLNCSHAADLAQLPAEATSVAIDFVTALHAYDTKRISELVVPDRREAMVREAFNGPNTAPVTMVETPKVTDGFLCGKAIKLSVRTTAEYSGGYKRVHQIDVVLGKNGNDWRIAGMAADYDSEGTSK